MIETLVQGEGLLTAICIIVMVVMGVESSIPFAGDMDFFA
jgi:hypothetical protein